ncbi:hypothetical protein NC651_007941 [Populus alba x Populus x berolinensis]|nr:hypothetical protein NC651_007941 [Populus alba x Populus x berolinensis]
MVTVANLEGNRPVTLAMAVKEKMHDGNSIVSRDGAIKFEKLISSKIYANMRRSFNRWMFVNFGYVIMLNVTYILTGGIVNIRLCLRAVTGGTFLENHPSRQPCSSAVMYFLNSRSPNFRSVRYCSDIGSFNRWMYVNFGYVILMTMMYNFTELVVGALQEGHNNNKEERVELLQLDYSFGLEEADIDWKLWNKMGGGTSYPVIG